MPEHRGFVSLSATDLSAWHPLLAVHRALWADSVSPGTGTRLQWDVCGWVTWGFLVLLLVDIQQNHFYWISWSQNLWIIKMLLVRWGVNSWSLAHSFLVGGNILLFISIFQCYIQIFYIYFNLIFIWSDVLLALSIFTVFCCFGNTDVNECAQPGICLPSERCVNTYGSYRCVQDTSCPQGHQVDPVTKTCKGNHTYLNIPV